jgi:5'-3' exonuclease
MAKKKRELKIILDADQFIFTGCKGMEKGVTDPLPSYSCTAVRSHIEKFRRERLMDELGDVPVILCMKDNRSGNFRKDIFPDYKENRPDENRPKNPLEVQDFLVREYGAWVASGQEADDLMGIIASADPENTMIISNDMDMLMVPGWHLCPKKWNQNFWRSSFYVEDPGVIYLEGAKINKAGNLEYSKVFATGLKCFYYKMLAGDSSDNVKFLYGCGIKKAYDLIKNCNTEEQMVEVVSNEYKKVYGNEWRDTMTLAGRVLWVRRDWNQMWDIPNG